MQVIYFTIPLREPSWVGFSSDFPIVHVSPIATYDSNKPTVYSSAGTEQFQRAPFISWSTT